MRDIRGETVLRPNGTPLNKGEKVLFSNWRRERAKGTFVGLNCYGKALIEVELPQREAVKIKDLLI